MCGVGDTDVSLRGHLPHVPPQSCCWEAALAIGFHAFGATRRRKGGERLSSEVRLMARHATSNISTLW